MGKLGFIGAGNMGGAIINGILKSGMLAAEEMAVADTAAERLAPYAEKGLATFTDSTEMVRACKYIVLSVKPQVLPLVLGQIKAAVTPETVFISIVAGVTAQAVRNKIGFDCKVIPVMPNTPLLVGCGAVAIARVQPILEEEFQFAADIFRQSGAVEIIPADRLNEVIPINGSSPAFIYYFAKVVCDYCTRYGFDVETSNRLFCNTLIGAAKMMLETGKTHDELIKAVCSPGGTTLKGLEALQANGFEHAVKECIDATIKRAYELGEQQ